MESTIQDGETALKVASFKGHQKVVELLLRAGANSDLQNKVKAGYLLANLSNESDMCYNLPVNPYKHMFSILGMLSQFTTLLDYTFCRE